MCTAVNTVFAENNNRGDTVNIKIDGSKANTSENFLYRGPGHDQLQRLVKAFA